MAQFREQRSDIPLELRTGHGINLADTERTDSLPDPEADVFKSIFRSLDWFTGNHFHDLLEPNRMAFFCFD
jgi:hypothetical protein